MRFRPAGRRAGRTLSLSLRRTTHRLITKPRQRLSLTIIRNRQYQSPTMLIRIHL
jgi:hypothetical protein